jgi:hypothetical protein
MNQIKKSYLIFVQPLLIFIINSLINQAYFRTFRILMNNKTYLSKLTFGIFFNFVVDSELCSVFLIGNVSRNFLHKICTSCWPMNRRMFLFVFLV